MRILVIEDERELARQLEQRLTRESFIVDVAHDGPTGLHMARDYPIDLAIVDLGLPGMPGLEIIQQLRAGGSRLPILILTARQGWQDRVTGLEAGADDYLSKPFRMEELLARMNALLRRTGGWAHPVLEAGPIALDTRTRSVSLHGQPLELTAYEYRLLEYLLHRPGSVISKHELTEHLYPDDADRDSNVIEVFIRRLRLKLDPGGSLNPIDTLRGRGYCLRIGEAPS